MRIDFYSLDIPNTDEFDDIICNLNASISNNSILRKNRFMSNGKISYPFLISIDKNVRDIISSKYNTNYIKRTRLDIDKKIIEAALTERLVSHNVTVDAVKQLFYRLDERDYIYPNSMSIASNILELNACSEYVDEKMLELPEICIEPYEIFKKEYIYTLDTIGYTYFCIDNILKPGRFEEISYYSSYGLSPEGRYPNFYIQYKYNRAYVELFYPILNKKILKK